MRAKYSALTESGSAAHTPRDGGWRWGGDWAGGVGLGMGWGYVQRLDGVGMLFCKSKTEAGLFLHGRFILI